MIGHRRPLTIDDETTAERAMFAAARVVGYLLGTGLRLKRRWLG